MTTPHKGCYFWIDSRIPEDERRMSVMCTKCHDEHHPTMGGYYDFANGIGPWDIICGECGEILRKHVDQEKQFMDEIDEALNKIFKQE